MPDWKEPGIVLNEEELKQKKFRYWRDGEYVYYEAYGDIIKVRQDGKEAILLYCDKPGNAYSLNITEVKNGYVYFVKNSEYTYQSDWQYEAERTMFTYRVKADESRELQMVDCKEDIRLYGADDYTEGTTELYDPPKDVENPAKGRV